MGWGAVSWRVALLGALVLPCLACTARDGPQAGPVLSDREELAVHALSVARWAPGDPRRCGLDPPSPMAGSVAIFFGCSPARGPVLGAVPARRFDPPGAPREAALRALLAGPTAAERELGYLSNFGAETAGTPFRIHDLDDGLVAIDLAPSILDAEFLFVSTLDTAQIVATLGQFEEVERVVVLVGGEPLCRALGEC